MNTKDKVARVLLTIAIISLIFVSFSDSHIRKFDVAVFNFLAGLLSAIAIFWRRLIYD
jgi:hypothetical protein